MIQFLRGMKRHCIRNIRGLLRRLRPGGPIFYVKAFSQQGEDILINCLFQANRTGFYVDIGAHHPLHYSNTQLFYAQGWRGINIEPNPGIMAEFARRRPNDINLSLGIASKAGEMTYHVFSESALNTFDEATARDCEAHGRSELLDKIVIPTRTLASVLDEYLPPGTTIDFMSVDVEGLDEEVLRSNNWEKYRPRAIIAEDLQAFVFQHVMNSKLTAFLSSVGYTPVSKLVHSVVYYESARIVGSREVLIV